jgi:hypothetical protein
VSRELALPAEISFADWTHSFDLQVNIDFDFANWIFCVATLPHRSGCLARNPKG